MDRKTLRLATRKSPLALAQAEWVKSALQQNHHHLDVVIIPMVSEGDERADVLLAKVGGKGLFTKKLEVALRNFEADIAVHSMKDVPVTLPKGLCIPVITKREDPRDVFISLKYKHISRMRKLRPRIGTSSLRRQCQLMAQYPNYEMVNLRGNVQTRLEKLQSGEVDGLVLAAAGIHRLNLHDCITHYLSVEEMVPAVGQGALAIECRTEDKETQHLIQAINCETTHACVTAERQANAKLEGGCHVPIAVHAVRYGPTLSISGLVGQVDGKFICRAKLSGYTLDADSLGGQLAEELLAQGAKRILHSVYASAPQDGNDDIS